MNADYYNQYSVGNFDIEDGFDAEAASYLQGLRDAAGMCKQASFSSVMDAVRNSVQRDQFNQGLSRGLGGAIGAGMVGLGLAGGSYAISAIADQMAMRKYEKSLQDAIRLSPRLQGYGYETLRAYLGMIIKASPTVAAEPRLLANYLESMLDAEGHLNLATFAELSTLEGNMLQNLNRRHEVRNKILEGIGKGTIDTVGRAVGSAFHPQP